MLAMKSLILKFVELVNITSESSQNLLIITYCLTKQYNILLAYFSLSTTKIFLYLQKFKIPCSLLP
ncbi:unnamed protein product [Moneuplotes crassus]|uniref:Uncharacterized protein n=1 Tax=Euplotes crassus TaxID=5936 RepID=A0AAD1Y504_EUPCR|nr:unnamed protein product [Moneuplotes crassus]